MKYEYQTDDSAAKDKVYMSIVRGSGTVHDNLRLTALELSGESIFVRSKY